MADTDEPMRRAAARAAEREWNWSHPRCPYSDLQHLPDKHLPECAPFMFDEDDDC